MGRLGAYSLLKRILPEAIPSPFLASYRHSVETKRLSTNHSASGGVDGHGFLGWNHELGQKQAMASQEEEIRCIPIKAYFLCTRGRSCLRFPLRYRSFVFNRRGQQMEGFTSNSCVPHIHGFGSIDLKSMQTDNAYNVIPPTSRSLNYVTLRYCDFPPEITGTRIKLDWSCYRYMVVFQYGSAVLFNVADHEVEGYLDVVRKHASGLLPEMRKDDYAVVEKPQLVTWMQGGHDYIVLQSLDTDGIRIIGSVLGQSIALDHFIRQVDGIVEEFTDINRSMEKSGTFTMQRKKLFQLVGKANSNLADVILKLGLFERSEIAWRDANYAQILEYLRDEYELAQRFGSLNFKLKFVEVEIEQLISMFQ